MRNSLHISHIKALKKLFDNKVAGYLPDFHYSKELDKASYLAKGRMAYLSCKGGWCRALLIDMPPTVSEAYFTPNISWGRTQEEIKNISKYGAINKSNKLVGEIGCMQIEEIWDPHWKNRRDRSFGAFYFPTKDWGSIDLIEGREISYTIEEAISDVNHAFETAWGYIEKYAIFFLDNIEYFIGVEYGALDTAVEALMSSRMTAVQGKKL